jgi:prolipoprotein diacylglyceryltransferase
MEEHKYGLILIMGVIIAIVMGIVSYRQARSRRDQKSAISASDAKKNETTQNTPKNLK